MLKSKFLDFVFSIFCKDFNKIYESRSLRITDFKFLVLDLLKKRE